jgi:hypothetical protein
MIVFTPSPIVSPLWDVHRSRRKGHFLLPDRCNEALSLLAPSSMTAVCARLAELARGTRASMCRVRGLISPPVRVRMARFSDIPV